MPLSFWLVSITWFVRIYLGAGRLWLAWTISGLRAFSLLLNFLTAQNLNYREISRTIVEAHGGRLWAENKNVSGGAAFRFTLLAEEAGAD